MTDARGTFEHARYSQPRPHHGYCTDDMARVLIVTCREPALEGPVRELAALSLRFLHDAASAGDGYRNRMSQTGFWEDRPSVEDCWGRSIWALGTAIAHCGDEWIRHEASAQFEHAAQWRSPWPRAMAFAAIGAAEVLAVNPAHPVARLLLVDAVSGFPRPSGGGWEWPEARLSYANAIVPEAMIAAGTVLERPDLLQRGLELLEWLLQHESRAGHVSVTPVGGSGPGESGPGFDQQPIEVAALADACARAAMCDSNPRWSAGVTAATDWFLGDNDGKVEMWDLTTGGGYDGLQCDGPNLNQGTESTLALLATLQLAHRFTTVSQ
jgi:hypothetical protein